MTNFGNRCTVNLVVVLLLALSKVSSAWTTKTTTTTTTSSSLKNDHKINTQTQNNNNNNNRREFFQSIGVITTSVVATLAGGDQQSAWAAAAAALTQEQKDKDNILKGYARLQYLLDNWEKETTVCNTGQETTFGDKCERSPMKVMDYLGFRTINDPLFRADKTMMRLMALVPPDQEFEFMQAVEKYAEKAEEASNLAFVSSWGEANPGGGKDRVQLFIERSKNDVIETRDCLKTVIDLLGL